MYYSKASFILKFDLKINSVVGSFNTIYWLFGSDNILDHPVAYVTFFTTLINAESNSKIVLKSISIPVSYKRMHIVWLAV